jgi:anti-sigma factor RsiW
MILSRDIACVELVELVTDYLEGALPARQRRRFERHIAACEHCSTYLDQIRRTRQALGTLTEESIAPEARDALLHAFRDWHAT